MDIFVHCGTCTLEPQLYIVGRTSGCIWGKTQPYSLDLCKNLFLYFTNINQAVASTYIIFVE